MPLMNLKQNNFLPIPYHENPRQNNPAPIKRTPFTTSRLSRYPTKHQGPNPASPRAAYPTSNPIHTMQPITLDALASLAWDMITTYHREYNPGELIDPCQLRELEEEINNPPPDNETINGIPVYSLKINSSDTRDNSERELKYSFIVQDNETLYLIHP